MSNENLFKIVDGVLADCKDGVSKIVLPDEVTAIDDCPGPFIQIYEPFELTLSPNTKTCAGDLRSEAITVLNVPAGAELECSDFGPNHGMFFKLLKEINVDLDNTSCASENGILYSKDMSVLYSCPAAHEDNVVIPASVKSIGAHAFDGCKKLTEIVIPETVEEIGERAFMDCTALKRIVVQGQNTKIGKDAFLRCTKIIMAVQYDGSDKKKSNVFEFPWTEEIPENAFSGLNKLKTVVLPKTIKHIGKFAFRGCKSLEKMNLSKKIICDKKAF